MSFLNLAFAYFLPIFFGAWLLARRSDPARIALMLVGSLVFYAYNQWWTLGIILSCCAAGFGTALWLKRSSRPGLVLALGVGFNLAVLCYWKYTPLIVGTAGDLLGFPRAAADAWSGFVVPAGLSFYAFSGIAYMVDVYRGSMAPDPNLARFSLFTSFFPHLVAGPILRAREFLVHLRPGRLPDRPLAPWEGTFLIARGYFKKMVLADSIAAAIDPFFANITHPSTAGVWALPYIYLYAFQIYFDFSGYTDIARGLGLWFGFRWPENFNWPYLAASAQEFWRRWHMTLSRFLRDYLYIPLGGSRAGPWRTGTNLMITMLLGGLWHGASWSFALWGGLHGLFLIINRLWEHTALHDRLSNLAGLGRHAWKSACVVLTFNTVCLAWCFFRLTDVAQSVACLQKCLFFDVDKMFAGGAAVAPAACFLAGYGVVTLLASILTKGAALADVSRMIAPRPFLCGASWGGAVGLGTLALLLAPGGEKMPFIYFQF